MKLISIKEWTEKNFAEGSRPCAATVSRWVKTGEISGACVGGRVYVDDYFQFKNWPSEKIEPESVASIKLSPLPPLPKRLSLSD